jgi:YVTN family beta-propeller protein
LCYNLQNDKVYCADFGDDSVIVIDGASNRVVTTVGVWYNPWALCYDPQDNKVYSANYIGGVTVIRGASDSVVETIEFGSESKALTCNPVQNRVYVANYQSNSVSVVRDSELVGIEERAPLVGRYLSLEACQNPFRGQVRLQLTTNGPCPEVRIYDAGGRLVRMLRLAVGGERSAVWDGTDNAGRRLHAGVYLCRLTDASGAVATRVLVRSPE